MFAREAAIQKADTTSRKIGQGSVASMEPDKVTGPVQLSMLTFRGPQLPPDVRRVVDDLHNERHQGVRLVDALTLQKSSDGTMTQQPSPDPLPEIPSAGLISKLLDRAEAEATLAPSTYPYLTYESRTGRGIIFRGEHMPDPRDTVPPGSYALALLVEHRWAAPLHAAILQSDASPVGNAWIGIDALEEVGLISSETAGRLASA